MTPKALNRRIIQLPSLQDVNIVIRKVSIKQVGLSSGMKMVQSFGLTGVAQRNAEAGVELAKAASTEVPRPTEPITESPLLDPSIRVKIAIQSEREIILQGLISPTFTELCSYFEADPEEPEIEMGPDFDYLVEAILQFSGSPTSGMPGTRGSPAEQEMFPEGVLGITNGDGEGVRKDPG